jgi:hypothetical protein
MKLSSGAEIDIELNPEKLASDPSKLAELFDSTDIASLDVSAKQGLFKDLLAVKTNFQDAKASFEGVTTAPPPPPAIAFNNVASNGKMTLAMNENSYGLACLKEIGTGLAATGKIADQLYDPVAFATQGQSGRRLAHEKKSVRAL